MPPTHASVAQSLKREKTTHQQSVEYEDLHRGMHRTDGRTDGLMDGWMDRWIAVRNVVKIWLVKLDETRHYLTGMCKMSDHTTISLFILYVLLNIVLATSN